MPPLEGAWVQYMSLSVGSSNELGCCPSQRERRVTLAKLVGENYPDRMSSFRSGCLLESAGEDEFFSKNSAASYEKVLESI